MHLPSVSGSVAAGVRTECCHVCMRAELSVSPSTAEMFTLRDVPCLCSELRSALALFMRFVGDTGMEFKTSAIAAVV